MIRGKGQGIRETPSTGAPNGARTRGASRLLVFRAFGAGVCDCFLRVFYAARPSRAACNVLGSPAWEVQEGRTALLARESRGGQRPLWWGAGAKPLRKAPGFSTKGIPEEGEL